MAFVRRFAVSNAAAHNGARLPDVLDKTNTASQVWAKRAKGSVKRSLMEWRTEGGAAYRSKANEAHMNGGRAVFALTETNSLLALVLCSAVFTSPTV